MPIDGIRKSNERKKKERRKRKVSKNNGQVSLQLSPQVAQASRLDQFSYSTTVNTDNMSFFVHALVKPPFSSYLGSLSMCPMHTFCQQFKCLPIMVKDGCQISANYNFFPNVLKFVNFKTILNNSGLL